MQSRTDLLLQNLLSAINWAMGCNGHFAPRNPEIHPPFWWRKELASRAGLEYDGEKYSFKIGQIVCPSCGESDYLRPILQRPGMTGCINCWHDFETP